MLLRVTVDPPDGDAIDVVVDIEAAAPVRDMLAALAEAAGLPAGDVRTAVVERSGERVEGAQPVGEAGVLDGDRIRLERSVDASTVIRDAAGNGHDGLVDLVVVGGPLMGTRVPLAAGEHVVGRGPGADVVLADRSLSRRHLSVQVAPGEVAVTDLDSSNGTFVAGVALTPGRQVRDGEEVEAGRTLIAFEPRAAAPPARAGAAGVVPFNRPPRVTVVVPRERRTVPAPPGAAGGPGVPVAAVLLPVVVAALLFALTGSPTVLAVGVLTPGMAVWNHLEQRRSSGRSRRDDLERFDAALEETVAAVERDRAGEAAALRRLHPDAATLLHRVAELDAALWERRHGDPDVLALRLGVADRPSGVEADVQPGGDRELRARAEERLGASATLRSVPVVAPAPGLGLAGGRHRVLDLAAWIVAQAAVLHSPAELSIAAAIPAGAAPAWEWLKWLPHVRPGDIAIGAPAARALLERLAATGEGTLLLVDGDLALDRVLVSDAYAGGAAVVWLGRERRDLPGNVRTIVELDAEVARLRLTRVESGETIDDVAADGVTAEWADQCARLLAPVRDAAGRAAQAEAIPARVSLLELIGLPELTPSAVQARWETDREDLEAPLGATADRPFTIDPARSDGLRAVVAGMPGAGKSELLQSLVAALATHHPPTRLTFLLVDYKGGAAFGDCVELPHTSGLVTDLDAQLAERARVSLLAELRRREALLAAAGARSLRDLARRDPAAPPAILVVVDEFATLAREVPAFVDTMVDVAQRGRSLGLHLVLATQRPRGAVSDTMRANTNLRIAMRVADAAESQDVLEAPDAAGIPAGLPGRAIALTGRRADGRPELTAFQAAYASGRSQRLGRTAVSVSEFALAGGAGEPGRELSVIGDPGPTDLQAVVEATRAAAEHLRLRRPEPPWLPPLPDLLDLADLPEPAEPAAAVLGLTDEPADRAQRPFVLDLDRDGSALVFGASGSGKTTALRSIAAALAAGHGPADVHLYALDYASRGLRALEALPHCGAVIAGEDEERAVRLLERLERLAAERRRLLGEHGVASVAELAALGTPVPRVVVLLDGYPAFAAAFERVRFGRDVATVQRLAGEGRALGIHVIATADRRAGVPGGLVGVVPLRIVLRMADDDDYAALGVPRSLAAGADLPPGRGFTGDGVPVQLAVAGGDPARERAALEALGQAAGERHPGQSAPRIRTLPEQVARERLPVPDTPLTAVLGIGADALRAVAADLRDDHFLIAGPRRSGRSTALATAAGSLRRAAPELELHLLAPRRSLLTEWAEWTTVAAGAEACRASAETLLALLDRPAGAPVAVVVLDDGAELADLPALETLARRGRDGGVRLLAAAETGAAQRAYGGWVRELRSGRRALLLQPDPDTDGELVGARLPRPTGAPPGPGRGYLVSPAGIELVQVGA